jgi:putative Holliday junction resolvase
MLQITNAGFLDMPNGRILALDLGRRRIGLAVSDELGYTAQGLPTLFRKNKRADLDTLTKVIAEKDIRVIVIGDPRHMSGDISRQGEWTREFAEDLRRYANTEVVLWDERLTSVEASRVLRESGIGRQKRANAVDRLSAVILLQSYLDSLALKKPVENTSCEY